MTEHANMNGRYEIGARQTDGRNGYETGTWEGYVEPRTGTDEGDRASSYTGGWPSKEAAIDAARLIAKGMGAR